MTSQSINDMDDFDEDDEDTLENRYLTFRLHGETYGIEIRYVTEIVGVQKITEVPDMPTFIKGVINLRGRVIPVMDVRLRFHMESIEYDERTCVIVVDLSGTYVGLIVDTVQEVREIPEDQVSPPPSIAQAASGHFIMGMGKVDDEVNILLDVNKLLKEDEVAKLGA